MKDIIIERLLMQGHITVSMADQILNNKSEKVSIIMDLSQDSIIDHRETIILLKNEECYFQQPQMPSQPFPSQPYNPPFQPYNPNSPYWHVTCSMDPGLNRD